MPPHRAALALLLLLAPPTSAQVGDPFCFGRACPCGNDDQKAGCGNAGTDGSTTTGAHLAWVSGGAVVLHDDLVLAATGIEPGQVGVLLAAAGTIEIPFGDGLRCVGGGTVFRFPVRQVDSTGSFLETGMVASSQALGGGEIVAGSTWHYQGWYRDPAGPCGTEFNTTTALTVQWNAGGADHGQLIGNPTAKYPWFEYVRAINEGAPIHLAFDPLLLPQLAGQTGKIFLVEAKTRAEWDADPTLVDVRPNGAGTWTFAGTDLQSSTYQIDSGGLAGTLGADVGIGYDAVIDLDGDGRLDPGEPIDGYSDEAGFYVVRDVAAPGPYAVTEALYSGGAYLGQDLFYPSNIAALGELPLVVISHGNGHDYRWYDHLGTHLASYGYVVVSHQNNTAPGIEAASTTTLTNTDYLIGNQASIAGGALLGHLDASRITLIGHSRGAEGVVRAYTRVVSGAYTPAHFTAADIVLVSSIAPTTYLSSAESDPGLVNYHLWVGSADSDVTGFGSHLPYALLERARGNRSSITLQGAGHAAFHDGGGSLWASGPCLLDRATTHQIMRGQILPLVKHHVEGDLPSKDFLWRQWESLRPIGGPPTSSHCAVVTFDYTDGSAAGRRTNNVGRQSKFVIDDYQSELSTSVASCGGAVAYSVTNVVEGILRDDMITLDWYPSDPMNGMTRARPDDDQRGVVFDWAGSAHYEVSIPDAARDFTGWTRLSLRACQGTRHPFTTSAWKDLTFDVVLRDQHGAESAISCGFAGGGVEEPYARGGMGFGYGWANEFETIRLRLTDFLVDGSGLDLTRIASVRLDFGTLDGSSPGRIGLDSIELTGE